MAWSSLENQSVIESRGRLRLERSARVEIPLDEARVVVADLSRIDLLAPDAACTYTDDHGSHDLPRDADVYTGSMTNGATGTVALVVSARGVCGILAVDGESFSVVPDGSDRILVVPGAPWAENRSPTCGTPDESPSLSTLIPRADFVPDTTRLVCGLAIDCDYEYSAISIFGGDVVRAADFALALIAAVVPIYERDIARIIHEA